MDLTKDYAFLPIINYELYKLYDTHKKMYWVPEDIRFDNKDRDQWDHLDDNTKKFLKFTLAFFAQFDGIVGENINANFAKETSHIKEAKHFYSIQNAIETIHNETYSLMIETFIRNDAEKKQMFHSIENFSSIKNIALWIKNNMTEGIPLPRRIIVMACLEGIIFSSSFASIYYIKRLNILESLTKANEFIARDEALHTEFAIKLYKILTKDELYHDKYIKTIITEAVDVAIRFTEEALNVDLIGLKKNDMINYIKCVADKIYEMICAEKIYNVENPFEWMNVISLQNKSNFFETTVSEYSKPTRSNDIDEKDFDNTDF